MFLFIKLDLFIEIFLWEFVLLSQTKKITLVFLLSLIILLKQTYTNSHSHTIELNLIIIF